MLSFNDLILLVGQFLFRWSSLEQELSRTIRSEEGGSDDRVSVGGTFKARLERWKCLPSNDANQPHVDEIIAEIEKLRSIRNLIVHGLVGGNSAPDGDVEPHIKCLGGGWESPAGGERVITVSELKQYTAAVDACWRGLANPNHFNSRH